MQRTLEEVAAEVRAMKNRAHLLAQRAQGTTVVLSSASYVDPTTAEAVRLVKQNFDATAETIQTAMTAMARQLDSLRAMADGLTDSAVRRDRQRAAIASTRRV